MRSVLVLALCSAAAAAAAAAAAPAPATAQQWLPPQPPCDITPGHFRLNSAVVNLKTAAEQPAQRDRMLRQTQDVITRSIILDRQDRNPAAWYYFGRYYAEMKDAAGADSAFDRAEALAPQCKDDIAGYRQRLWVDVMGRGFGWWQSGNEDSALAAMRLASALWPSNPKSLLQIGTMFANKDNVDSAVAYLRRAAEVAGTDTAYRKERRDARQSIGRLYLRQTFNSPALEQWRRTRFSRDSLERAIANDSVVLSRLRASSASRRARGTRLSPADQRGFTRDSTARARSLARGREARPATVQRAAADSGALEAAFAPVVRAFREYLADYPDALDAATSLAGLFGQMGRPNDAAGVFDSALARAPDVDATQLFDVGQRLVLANMFSAGARALKLGLQKNPNYRDALFSLAQAYISLKDTTNALQAAERLVGVDPMNRFAIRMLAEAWQLKGNPDSTLRYLQVADSILEVDVTVSSFVVDSAGVTLTALASNPRSAPNRPFRLVFEFLDPAGGVVSTQTADVPAVTPGESHQIAIQAPTPGVVAWRYRRGN